MTIKTVDNIPTKKNLVTYLRGETHSINEVGQPATAAVAGNLGKLTAGTPTKAR